MEATIITKPSMRLVGLATDVATDVTLHDVQHNRTTLKLSASFMERKWQVKNGINQREVFGLSTDPDNYNPDTDQFEFFIGVEVSPHEDIPDGMVYREVPANTYVRFSFVGPFEKAGLAHSYLYINYLKLPIG